MTQDEKNALAELLATKFTQGDRRVLLNELGEALEHVTLRATNARDEAWEIVAHFGRLDDLPRLAAQVERWRPRSRDVADRPMRRLPADRIQALYTAAVACGLASQQDALLAGLPGAYTATLPHAGQPAARLLQTLHALNDVPALADGMVPLAVWLQNAATLTSASPDARVFKDAMREIGNHGSAVASGSRSTSSTTDSRGTAASTGTRNRASSDLTKRRDAIARIDIVVAGGARVRGTGALIGERLILTALHVVADRHAQPPTFRAGPIRVTFPSLTTTARVLDRMWDARADWVLMECTEAPTVDPLPLDTLRPDEHDVPWETWGFPDAYPTGMRIVGSVLDPKGLYEGVTAIQLYSDQAAAGDGAPVSGLSGAPCIVECAVVGMVRSSLLAQGRNVAGTLFACPVPETVRRAAVARGGVAVGARFPRSNATQSSVPASSVTIGGNVSGSMIVVGSGNSVSMPQSVPRAGNDRDAAVAQDRDAPKLRIAGSLESRRAAGVHVERALRVLRREERAYGDYYYSGELDRKFVYNFVRGLSERTAGWPTVELQIVASIDPVDQ